MSTLNQKVKFVVLIIPEFICFFTTINKGCSTACRNSSSSGFPALPEGLIYLYNFPYVNFILFFFYPSNSIYLMLGEREPWFSIFFFSSGPGQTLCIISIEVSDFLHVYYTFHLHVLFDKNESCLQVYSMCLHT